MALKPILTSLDDVPEPIRDHYVEAEANGQKFFKLEVEAEGGWELRDTANLLKALEMERKNAKDASKKLKSYEGLDPKEAREALAKVAEMANWNPDDKINEAIQAREKQILDKHQRELERYTQALGEKDTRIKSLQEGLHTHVLRAAATRAVLEKEGRPRPVVLDHVLRHMKLVEDDEGAFAFEIVGEDGRPLVTRKPGSTLPMGLDEFVETMREDEDFSAFFKATSATGAGSTGAKQVPNGRVRTVSARDPRALSKNLEAIAKGEVKVTDL